MIGCGIRKCLRTFIREGKFYDVLGISHVILRGGSSCIGYFTSVKDNGSVGEFKIEGTRLAQFLQNLIRVGDAGDFNVDPVIAFLVYRSFGTIVCDTLLQLIDGIIHIFLRVILSFLYLIGDGNTAGQVQTELNVSGRAGVRRSPADGYGDKSKDHQRSHEGHDYFGFLLRHLFLLLYFFYLRPCEKFYLSACAALIISAHSTLLRCSLQPIS